MNLLIKCCPDRFTLCLAANVLVQIAVLAALAWLLASAVARHRPALCHGIWLSALLCILLSPAVSCLAVPAGLSLISLPWLPHSASTAVELPPPLPPVSSIEPSLLAARDMLEARNPGLRPDFAPMRPLSPVQNGVSPTDQEAAPAERTASVTPPPAAGDKLRAVLGLVVLLWSAGTFLFLLRLFRGWSRVVRLQRWAPPASDPTARSFVSGCFAGRTRLDAVLAEVRHDLNVAVLPRLAILPRESKLCGPITVGVFRPLVILHETLIETLDACGFRNVLLHEFAHALRRDPLVGLLQRLAAAVFWPYPPVHLVNRRLAAAREEVCDNYVLRRGDAADYAETLLTIYESLRGVRLHPSTLGLCHPCGNLEHRVAGMLNPRRNVMVRMYRVTAAAMAALFLTAVVLVAGTRLVEAQTKAPPATRTPPAADAGGKKEATNEQDGKKGGGGVSVRHREQEEMVLGVRPQGNCSIAGKVVAEATGAPIAGARMYLHYNVTHGSIFVNTAADGSFAFNAIPQGSYSLVMSHVPGYQDVSYSPLFLPGKYPPFALGEDEHRAGIVLRAKYANRISGKIVDEDGKLPPGGDDMTVLAWFKKWGGNGYESEHATVNRGNGSYVIDGLGNQPVYVMAINWRAARQGNANPPVYYPGTFSRSDAKLITFGKTRSIDNVNITWRKKGGLAIAGTVRDASGKPIPQAFVVVHRRDMLFDFVTVYTDQQGRYEIQGLGDGEFLIHVDAVHRGFVRTREPIDLVRDAKRTQKDFTLARGVLLSGKFVDDKGQPWQIGESYGCASIGASWGHGFSLSNFRNKYRPNDTSRASGGDFELGKGPYDDGQMLFPTSSTFIIQGMTSGHCTIHFSPNKEGQQVAKILYQGRDVLSSGFDTLPSQEITDLTIVIQTPHAPAPGDKKPAAATGKQGGPAAEAQSANKSPAPPPLAEGEDETSVLDKIVRNAARVPEGKRFHLVRSSHTWIGNDGEPLVYDDYDKQFYMSRGAHTVVLSPPGEGFSDFYGARTLDPQSSRMDVSNDHPASEPLANIVLPGAIDLPAYQLLWQPSVQQALKLSEQQRIKLRDISANYWPARRQIAGKELADTESATHKELVEYSTKAHSGIVRSNHLGDDELPFSKDLIAKLERQWSDTRKQIEEVLTPEQLRTLKGLTFRTFAFGSGVMFEPAVLQRLGVPQKRQDELRTLERQLRKEKERRLHRVTQEKIKKMLAVLTPEQQAQLRKNYGPDKHPETDCSSFPYPMLPSFMPDSGAAEGLGLTAEQSQRVRAIVTAHWMTLIRLQSAEQQLTLGDEKGFKAIGEKRRQEMADLRKQIEATLTPQQWATCREIAFENQAVTTLRGLLHWQASEKNQVAVIVSGLLGDTIVPTAPQQPALRAVEAEYFDKPQQIYCEMTDKALAAFTPAQQEQLRAEVDRLGW